MLVLVMLMLIFYANDDANDYANHIRFANDDHWNVISYISWYRYINL